MFSVSIVLTQIPCVRSGSPRYKKLRFKRLCFKRMNYFHSFRLALARNLAALVSFCISFALVLARVIELNSVWSHSSSPVTLFCLIGSLCGSYYCFWLRYLRDKQSSIPSLPSPLLPLSLSLSPSELSAPDSIYSTVPPLPCRSAAISSSLKQLQSVCKLHVSIPLLSRSPRTAGEAAEIRL